MLNQPYTARNDTVIHSFENELYYALVKAGENQEDASLRIRENTGHLVELNRGFRSQAIDLQWP